MSQNYYAEIYLHLTWHTKLSRPMLNPQVAEMAYSALREKAAALGGILVHDIGGIATHVHLAISIQPTVTISEMVGALKGYTSHEVNHRAVLSSAGSASRGGKVLEWQTGYGVVSFGAKDLDWVLAYIRNQEEHHAKHTDQDRLERITEFDDPPQEG
jgi:putative transposase